VTATRKAMPPDFRRGPPSRGGGREVPGFASACRELPWHRCSPQTCSGPLPSGAPVSSGWAAGCRPAGLVEGPWADEAKSACSRWSRYSRWLGAELCGASQGESGLGLVCIHSIQSQGLGVPRSLQPLGIYGQGGSGMILCSPSQVGKP
jgi:hypothetical protein